MFFIIEYTLDENIYYQESFHKLKGFDVLLAQIDIIFKKAYENNETKQFDNLEELLEVLIMLSQVEKWRILFKEDNKTLKIYQNYFEKYLIKFENEPKSLASFISFISNLCYGTAGTSLIKNHIIKDPSMFLNMIRKIYESFKHNIGVVKENMGNFLVNLCNETKIREFLSTNEEFLIILLKNLKSFDIKKNNRFIGSLTSLLGVFSNLCFQANAKAMSFFETIELEKNLRRFIEELQPSFEGYKEIFLRILNILSKLSYNTKTFSFEYFQINFLSIKFFNENSIEKTKNTFFDSI